MGEIDEEKLLHVEETAWEMYEGGIDSLEILEYLTLSFDLTEDEADILEGTLEGWEENEQ